MTTSNHDEKLGYLTSQIENLRLDVIESNSLRETLRAEVRTTFHDIIEKQNAMIEKMDERLIIVEKELIHARSVVTVLKWIGGVIGTCAALVISWLSLKAGK